MGAIAGPESESYAPITAADPNAKGACWCPAGTFLPPEAPSNVPVKEIANHFGMEVIDYHRRGNVLPQ